MVFMATCKDKQFDLAIVDPPYGINHVEIAGKQSGSQYGNAAAPKGIYTPKKWDNKIPDKKYFTELFRISINQIIWGSNYFTNHIPPSMGWVVWDKNNGTNGFSDAELAFTSFDKGLRIFKYTWNGMIQQNMKDKEERIHVNQKPVQLYKWLLKNYAKEGDTILDTHGGSMSSVIACIDGGFSIVCCESDPEYYEAAKKRIINHVAQLDIFIERPEIIWHDNTHIK